VVATAKDEPQWLVDARAREATLPEAGAVASKDGRFKARVPAQFQGDIVEEQGSYSVELGLGAGVEPMYCEVYPEGIDLAHGITTLSAATFEVIAKSQGRIEGRELERTNAGWNGAAAFLQADWVYLVKVDGDNRLGALKQIIFERDDATLYCGHNEIGYARTFERVAHEFARTLEWAGAAPAARYSEVVAVRLGDRTLGVGRLSVTRDEDGDDRVVTSLSMLLPVTQSEVRSHDEVQVEFVGPDGEMLNAIQVSNQNGELDANLKLDPHEDGGWLVSGELKGKPVDARIVEGEGPATTLAQYALHRELLQGEKPVGRTLEYVTWSDEDPTVFTPQTVKPVARIDGDLWSAQIASSGLLIDAVFDSKDGSAIRAQVPLGPLVAQFERVAVSGRL
jgi:hypothetical protein